MDDGTEEKSKRHKKRKIYVCHKKKKLNFESYKNCLEATQLENKIDYLDYLEKVALT